MLLPSPPAGHPRDSYPYQLVTTDHRDIPSPYQLITTDPIYSPSSSARSSTRYSIVDMSYPPPHPSNGFDHLSTSYSPAVTSDSGEYPPGQYGHPPADTPLAQPHSHMPVHLQARHVGATTPGTRRSRPSVSASTDTHEEDADGTPSRKIFRVTVPRGHACVWCRARKLKCQEGVRPCSACVKSGMECRNEELPKRKTRADVLEDRVAELEAFIHKTTGNPAPPPVYSSAFLSNAATTGYAANSVTPPEPSSLAPGEYFTDAGGSSGLVTPFLRSGFVPVEIHPHSALELALVQFILPYTPFLHIPLHPQRFLALLSLPVHDPARPHPALLYILFFEAVTHLENRIPPRATHPNPLPPSSSSTPPRRQPPPVLDPTTILATLGGTAPALLDRARLELNNGIRHVDRPFDLVRAAVGVARALSADGKFIESWTVPVAQLVVSCGLHRISGIYVPPDGSPGDNHLIPKPYAPAYHYPNSHSHTHEHSHEQNALPQDGRHGQQAVVAPLRMRPVILPPARDGIEVAERVMTFWAAKMVCWQGATGWGWADPLPDEQCTTEWPWGWGHVEVKPFSMAGERYTLKDLYDPSSGMHMSSILDTTYVLAVKSTALLARASSLYDLPEASYPVALADGRIAPPHIAPPSAIDATKTAIDLFRARIPPALAFPPPAHTLTFTAHGHAHPTPLPSPSEPSSRSTPSDRYDGTADPWWILLHANLNAAEMLTWRERANHYGEASRDALRCASMLVNLVRAVPDDCWANVDILVAQALSLGSRLLTKEAASLRLTGQAQSAARMDADSELLRRCLDGPFSRFLNMAGVHSWIVQRVREGWTDKEGEYERV